MHKAVTMVSFLRLWESYLQNHLGYIIYYVPLCVCVGVRACARARACVFSTTVFTSL